jgi:hypothetical protein
MPGMLFLHADQFGASRLAGAAILRAGEAGLITDTNVTSATTYAGFRSVLTTQSGHADLQPLRARAASLMDIANADGALTNTTVAAATGYRNLASLTEVDDTRTYGGID